MRARRRVRRLLAGGVAALLAGAGLVGLQGAFAAGSVPPWEPDPSAVGTVTFFDASGAQITSGSVNDAPLATYFKASGPKVGSFAFNKGYVVYYTPQDNVPTGSWTTGETWTAAQDYTALQPSYPAGLNTPATNVVVKGSASDGPFATHITNFPSASATAPGVYQVRLYTSANATTYYTADIKVSGTTWTQVYPSVNSGASTSTSLAVSPAGPVQAGTAVTLTATVSPSGAAGTVQFSDGASPLGAPAAVSGGVAAATTSSLTAGTHALKATFLPGDPSAFAGSTSSTTSLVVTAVAATATTTSLSVTPSGPVASGTPVSLSATVSPAGAVGQIQFSDGATALGAPVTPTGGNAVTQVSSLAVGTHALKASFVPGSPAWGASSSAATSLVVTAPAALTPDIGLTVSPAGPVTQGTSVVLKATLSPTSAAGSVTFKDGGTTLGQAVVTGGVAQLSTSSLGVGSHTLGASFAPANPAAFTAAAASPVTLVVVPAPPGATTTTLAVTPAGPVGQGTPLTLSATVSPSAATGTVQFYDQDGTAALGAPVPVVQGKATLPVSSLGLGRHPLSATFTSSAGNYLGSVSGQVTLIVATPTTTSLSLSPSGPVQPGTRITVTAAVSPAAAGGTLEVLDGTAVVASAAAAQGQAVVAFTPGVGAHAVRARFVPADATVYAGSTSAPVSLTVLAPPAVPTTTSLSVSDTAVVAGTPLTLSATVAPTAATGVVTFIDGSRQIAKASLSAGRASAVVRLGGGSHAVRALFTPASAAAFTTSSSASTVITVDAEVVPSITDTHGRVYPSGSAIPAGASLAITAAGFIPGEDVAIVVRSTPVVLTRIAADSSGIVHTTVALPADLALGPHTLTLSGLETTAFYSFTLVAATSSTGTGSGDAVVPGDGTTTGEATSDGSLASTGAQVLTAGLLGMLLMALGGVLVLAVRRVGGGRE